MPVDGDQFKFWARDLNVRYIGLRSSVTTEVDYWVTGKESDNYIKNFSLGI